MIYKPFK